MEKMIQLASDTISKNDIDALCKWLSTYPKLTKGDLTKELESKFADKIGTDYSVFVNSGSSANLLMLSVLMAQDKLKIGDNVGIPALCWSTDLAPVLQLGLNAVLLDCNGYHLGIEISNLQSKIKQFNIKCILDVSVLGIPGDTEYLYKICDTNKVILLQDNCESLGSKLNNSIFNNCAIMSSWSTYFSHHISTIEGGFVTTSCRDVYELLLKIRSHGWSRDLPEDKRDVSFYGPYTFSELGYNVRNTEIGAFLGLRQINMIDKIAEHRRKNFIYFCEQMADWLSPYDAMNIYSLRYDKDRYISNFGLPVIVHNDRNIVVERLENNNIQCRPLIAGNIGRHPVANKYKNRIKSSGTAIADIVHDRGLYLPNHLEITTSEIDRMVSVLKETK